MKTQAHRRSTLRQAVLLTAMIVAILAACNGTRPEVNGPPELTVTPSQATIGVNETVGLTVSSDGAAVAAGSLNWSSNAPEVAAVDRAGVVAGLQAGNVTITVVSTDGRQAEAEVTVTSAAPAPDPDPAPDPAAGPDPEPPVDQEPVPTPELPVLTEFKLEGELWAGSKALFSWQVQNAASVTITTIASDGGNHEVHGPFDAQLGSAAVPLPSNFPKLNFQLTAVNGAGELSRLLAPAKLPVHAWICSEAAQEITFADRLVENAVRVLFDLAEGPVYCGDVQRELPSETNESGQETRNLLFLSRGGEPDKITSLEGLQHLSKLKRLELEHNALSDIRALHGLTGLVELNLDNNSVVDLTPLAGLTQLEILGIYDNQVETLEGLQELHNLKILYASLNRIKDLEPLRNLDNLELLWLIGSCREPAAAATRNSDCLNDLSPLGRLNRLESFAIAANEITDLTVVAAFSSLQLLYAKANGFRDLSALRELPLLETVFVEETPVADLSPLVDNATFGTMQPYSFQRGTVSMPPRGTDPFHNLHAGYNCLDDDSYAKDQNIAVLDARAAPAKAVLDFGLHNTRGDCSFAAAMQPSGPPDLANRRSQVIEEWKLSRGR